MKIITIPTRPFANALKALQGICNKKTVSMSTQNLNVEYCDKEVIINANDMEVYASIDIPVIKYVNLEDGKTPSFSLNAKKIYEFIKDINLEYIDLEISDRKISINHGHAKIALAISDNKEQVESKSEFESIAKVNPEKIIDLLSFTAPLTTCTNLGKQEFSSVYIEVEKNNIKSTSTDGYSLAHMEIESEYSDIENLYFDFSISKRAAGEIKRILEVYSEIQHVVIGRSKSKAVFTSDKITIEVRKATGSFPDYRSIVGSRKAISLKVDRESVLKSFKRLSYMTDGKFLPAKLLLNMKENIINLKLENKEVGSIDENIGICDKKATDSTLEKVHIQVFPPYLLQAATLISSTAGGDKINIFLDGETQPVLIKHKCKQKTATYVVMPITETI
jgi:DNA polymerase III sliding clamp (beta) subunit (PCNA family)